MNGSPQRVLLALFAFTAACSSNESPSTGTGSPSPASVTFHKDVEPILQRSCQACHSPGNIAPFDLTGYREAVPFAALMATRTAERSMPPWGAFETAECKPRVPWKDDLRLTDADIAIFDAWSRAGAPEGDPNDAPAPKTFPPPGLSGTHVDLEPNAPYTLAATRDQFRCFVLDPGLTEDRYLNGYAVVPGNARIVHHVLVFLDKGGTSVPLADANGAYDCFGGAGISSPSLVAAWAPGGPAFEFGPKIGMLLPKGSKLVMQVHYHPIAGPSEPDATKFQMRFLDGNPDYTLGIALIGNFSTQDAKGNGLLPGPDDTTGIEFRIPAGVKGHTESMRFALAKSGAGAAPSDAVKLYGIGTHMHYVGTDMKIDLAHTTPSPGEPASECLVQTPQWNFNWQRLYLYQGAFDALPSVHSGDVLNLRCTYDNTLGNPFVLRALADQGISTPGDVKLGETTLDEMCLGVAAVLTKGKTTVSSAPDAGM